MVSDAVWANVTFAGEGSMMGLEYIEYVLGGVFEV